MSELTRVYYNLHKRRLSIQQKRRNKSGKLFWKVIEHVNHVTLRDPVFKVSEKGRERVLKEKKKNVHAYVEGYPNVSQIWTDDDMSVFYNPYKNSTFVDCDNNPIKSSSYVLVEGNEKGYSIKIKQ